MAKEKVVGQLTRKPLRLTPMQKKLAEGVRDLIRLYYLFKDNEPFIPAMKDFLNRITGKDFEHHGEAEPSWRVRYGRNLSRGDYFLRGSLLINFDDSQKVLFVKVMDMLHESITKRIVHHFLPASWIFKSEANIEPLIYFLYPDTSIAETLIDNQFIETLRKQERQSRRYSLGGRNVMIHSEPYRAYKVVPGTLFGVTLLTAESGVGFPKPLPVQNHPFRDRLLVTQGDPEFYFEIPSISFDMWHNFFEIIQSLLVNYHIVFGNFEYVKVCEWEKCQKLFIEKRKGRGRFCSKECQRKFKQASPKYKCMNRQNTWIRREIPKIVKEVDKLRFKHEDIRPYNPSTVHVSEGVCEKCGTCMKSGKCADLIKNNKKVLSIQKALPVIQKEFSTPLIKKKEVVDKLNRLLRSSN